MTKITTKGKRDKLPYHCKLCYRAFSALMNNTGQSDRPRRFPKRLLLLSATFLFVFMGAGAQQAYLVPYLGRVTDWTPVRCSTIIAAVYGSMLVFRVLNIYLFARWTDRRFTIVGSTAYLFFTLAMYASATLKSYPFALASAIVWGAGGAMMWTGTTMQTLAAGDEAGGRHGTGMGILYASTHLGWVSGVVVLGLLYKALPAESSRTLYLVAAGITAVGISVACRLPATGEALRETPGLRDVFALIRRERALIAGVLQLTSALAFGLVLGSFGQYVQDEYGAQWIWISIAFYPATRMVLSLAGGITADRVGHAATLVIGFLAGSAGLAVVVLWDHPLAVLLGALTLGLLSSCVPVVASAIVGQGADTQRRPIVYGVIFAWRDLGVTVAAVGVNLLGLHFSFDTAFTVFIFVFLGCAVLSLFLARFADQRL